MFDEVMGLPAHVLMVHAAVVFVPLLALAAVVYALVPRLRARVGWVAALLAVAAPLAALFAMLSGREFLKRQIGNGAAGEFLAKLREHEDYGELTFWFSLALGVVTGVLVLVTSRAARQRSLPLWIDLVLVVAVVVLAAVTGYYVFQSGDTGASAVWGTS